MICEKMYPLIRQYYHKNVVGLIHCFAVVAFVLSVAGRRTWQQFIVSKMSTYT